MLDHETRESAAPQVATPAPARAQTPASVPRNGAAPGPAVDGVRPPPADALAGRLAAAVQRRAAAVEAPLLQRTLDEDFPHGGTPRKGEIELCHAFAEKVSAIVDQVYLDLVAGNVKGWKGAKIGTFLKLLLNERPAALVHFGNAIEERVYAVMRATDLGETWEAQFDANMGGASFPDVVVHLKSGARGLIDVTSDRRHILGKAGAWCTSVNYIYVAEAWFPSVYKEHLGPIAKNVRAGGVDTALVEQMLDEADEARAARLEARELALAEAREERNQYGSYTEFVREKFGGKKGLADAWMRANGLGNAKGVAPRKKRRGLEWDQKAKKRRVAVKSRLATMTPEEKKAADKRQRRAAEERKQHKAREEQYAKRRLAALDVESEEEDEDVDIV